MNGPDQYHRALVPPIPPTALVQPTPIYELLFSLVVFWMLWQLGKALGRQAGGLAHRTLPGAVRHGRFLVEFVRINPPLYFHQTMSNAQVAAAASVIVGLVVIALAQATYVEWTPKLAAAERRT